MLPEARTRIRRARMWIWRRAFRVLPMRTWLRLTRREVIASYQHRMRRAETEDDEAAAVKHRDEQEQWIAEMEASLTTDGLMYEAVRLLVPEPPAGAWIHGELSGVRYLTPQGMADLRDANRKERNDRLAERRARHELCVLWIKPLAALAPLAAAATGLAIALTALVNACAALRP